jgi:hypothetical protein
MWDFLYFLFDPFLICATRVLEFLYEDSRPEARKITVGCAVLVAVIAIASVVAAYLATMR